MAHSLTNPEIRSMLVKKWIFSKDTHKPFSFLFPAGLLLNNCLAICFDFQTVWSMFLFCFDQDEATIMLFRAK